MIISLGIGEWVAFVSRSLCASASVILVPYIKCKVGNLI